MTHRPAIAVTGYAAVLPGAPDVSEVWSVLKNGRCTVTEVPEERWSSAAFLNRSGLHPGRTYTRSAGIIENVYDFDASYFGISPREAQQMDPQQRLLLEVTAQAFDHAGIDPSRLDLERTGVFIGSSGSDHSTIGLTDPALVGAHYMLGNTLSIFANRISYQWNLRGPSHVIDTACSSGLFALDQARLALEDGSISTAIVGAVNLLLSPLPFVGFSQAGMLSRRGLCRAFAAEPDGYVRAEGAVVFILENADQAHLAGRRIRSRLVTTAVNTVGRSTGLSMPSADRQIALIDAVLQTGRVNADDLAFVEAHGTGTAAGDPREALAIGRTYGARRNTPLPIGSSKTNFGHLEPASGLVGLLKAQLSLENRIIPASLHCDALNPDIDFSDLNLAVMREARDLPDRDRPWLAAVNSFGFGGANAHAVLEQVPHETTSAPVAMPPTLLLSAASSGALRQLVESWRTTLRTQPQRVSELAQTANWHLARHRHRLVVPAENPTTLVQQLDDWHSETATFWPGAAKQSDLRNAPVAFVFSGNGALWDGVAQQMFRRDKVFADSFRQTSEAFNEHGFADLTVQLFDAETPATFGDAHVAQPLTCAIQLGLVDTLAAAGVTPRAVLGHSLGEYAAAVTAGRLSRRDAVRLIATRCAVAAEVRGKGTMAAVAASRATVLALIDELALPLDIAAENTAESVTISGPEAALEDFRRAARKRQIAVRLLAIDYPYHGAALDPLEARLRRGPEQDDLSDGEIEFYSGWLGVRHAGPLDGNYWWHNSRDPVAFRRGCNALAADGYRVIVEISPRTVLANYIRTNFGEIGEEAQIVATLDSTNASKRSAASIARAVTAAGGAVREDLVFGRWSHLREVTPLYPFERKHYQLESAMGTDVLGQRPRHPLLGAKLRPDLPEWRGNVSLDGQPWLRDHRVGGAAILPATAIVEMLVTAGGQCLNEQKVGLRDVRFHRPLELPDQGDIPIRVVHEAQSRGLRLEAAAADNWVLIASARVFAAGLTSEPVSLSPRTDKVAEQFYARLAERGLAYGPAFARLSSLVPLEGCVEIRVAPAPEVPGFSFDASAADATLHAIAHLMAQTEPATDRGYIPARIDRVEFIGPGTVAAARLWPVPSTSGRALFDVAMFDPTGQPVLQFFGLELAPIPGFGAAEPLLWEEVLVPVTAQALPDIAPLIEARSAAPGDLASDHDVIRAAVAGRLAWDIAVSDQAAPRQRAQVIPWLAAAGRLTIDDKGAQHLVGDCPWPDIDSLIGLMTASAPDATTELHALLTHLTDTNDRSVETLPDLGRVLVDLLSDQTFPQGGRLLLAGSVDSALVAAALRKGEMVTIAVEDEAHLQPMQARLVGTAGVRLVTISALADDAGFDLVLGVGLAQVLPTPAIRSIVQSVAPNGQIILVDEMADMFALITGRHAMTDAIEQLCGVFQSSEIVCTTRPLRGKANVRVTTGRRNAAEPGAARPDLPDHVFVVDDPSTPMDFPTVFRNLTERQGPVWIVVHGTARWHELTGWRRSFVNETGRDIRVVCHDDPPVDIAALIAGTRETEIIVTASGAQSPRVKLVKPQTQGPQRLVTQGRSLAAAGLTWAIIPESVLADDEVEIAVSAAGLNYRDIMWSRGLLPAEAFDGGYLGPCLGMECSGLIARAGAASGFACGERVIAFAPHSFAERVITKANAVIRIPDDLDLGAAATLPVIYLTADYALNEVARLQRGERILIHGAAGGVGYAAIRLAQHIGAEIFATAGTPEKRRYLSALGVPHVMDSRNVAFEEQIATATHGRGVAVVLNSLFGEAMERSLNCLAPFGRFIELGKRDFFENTMIGLRAMRRNISYHGVDVDQLMSARPEIVAMLNMRIQNAIAAGVTTPPPFRRLAADAVAEGFRMMRRSAHLGKIVIEAPISTPISAEGAIHTIRGAWLVVGGTQGFGLETAIWLAGQRAEHLFLVSRSGTVSSADAERLGGIGCRFTVVAADMANLDAAGAAFAEITAQADLKGIVHAGASFADGMFAGLDDAAILAIMSSKLQVAKTLDQLSRGLPLDHFWLFSSVAARFGNPGQSAYVAANRGLEQLAIDRQKIDQPALAIAWGPIGDTGYLARSATIRDQIAKQVTLMSSKTALAALKTVLDRGEPRACITISPDDWSRLPADLRVLNEPLFDLIPRDQQRERHSRVDLKALIATEGMAKARQTLVAAMVEQTAGIMLCAVSDIDPKRPLGQLGFDSLMAMNLRMALEDKFGLQVPVMGLSEDVTLTTLANRILDTLTGASESDEVVDAMAARHVTDNGLSATNAEMILNTVRKAESL